MKKIRPFILGDCFKTKCLKNFYTHDDMCRYNKFLSTNFFPFFQNLVPLKFRRLPETYVRKSENELWGLIKISPTFGNPRKINIIQLLIQESHPEVAKDLLRYVLLRYSKLGARSFHAVVDDTHEEILDLFLNGCKFKQCSSEQIWKIDTNNYKLPEIKNFYGFRTFKNSDAVAVAMLFNDSIQTPLKPYLSKNKSEFRPITFQGMYSAYELQYVLEIPGLHTLLAYISIKTYDNYNYIADITCSVCYEVNYETLFNFIITQISKRVKKFSLFVKSNRSTINYNQFEEFMKANNFKIISNSKVLVKDNFQQLKSSIPIVDLIFGKASISKLISQPS